MTEIPIDFTNNMDQTGNFTINDVVFDYWLRWNWTTNQWNIDLRTPDITQYVIGLTLAPNEFVLRQTGLSLLPENEDFMLVSPDFWMDLQENPLYTQLNYKFVHLDADDVAYMRELKYGTGAVENLG